MNAQNPLSSRAAVAALSLAVSLATAICADPPAPHGPVPSARQLEWRQLEFYGFIHFTVNTFTDKEWGGGEESPAIFNPSQLDAKQWAQVARDAGMKGLILTAKHHDGFCLWPSKYTAHSVKNSPWKEGNGDVVRELADACRDAGLKFGVYLSPWDRNHKDYARPEYITYYRQQLRELMTGYGPLFEVWFDGANGGDGFYGGAREKRTIDNKTYYDWPNTWSIVRELQPRACMFSDAGPDVRWVGNERGIAGDPCWSTLNAAEFAPGVADPKRLNRGDRPGTDWLPAECDVSIRPGWFYHASEDSKVKTPQQLLDIYYKSVGRGASLLVNIPPDRRGLIHENDAKSLREFRRILDETFKVNLAMNARATASNTRGNDSKFAAANLLDNSPDTCWATDDQQLSANAVLEWSSPVTFNVVSLREHLPLGERVEEFALESWQDGAWKEFARGTNIGNRRLWRGEKVTTTKLRLRIDKSAACPVLSELGVHVER